MAGLGILRIRVTGDLDNRNKFLDALQHRGGYSIGSGAVVYAPIKENTKFTEASA
jgi:hypothetical protein